MNRSVAALLAVLLWIPLGHAADPQIKFEKYKLPNGLTVILSEDHRLPQVAVDIWYHVGAANQTPGKSGFAHLFEHMMFSGAKHIGPEPFRVLESIGTTAGGMANGTTSFDRTNYFEVVASPELPTALWLESDRMAFLLDTLDEDKLKKQRNVVSNERRQSYENRPYGTTALRLFDDLYPAPHPYFDGVIGTIDEIQSASMQDLRSFFRTFYGPNNASLVLVGDFDPQKAKALIEKYFGPVPRVADVARPTVPQPRLTREVRETVKDAIATEPRIEIVWNGIKPYASDEAAGDVLAFVLGQGKTSRFYKLLVFDKQVAQDASASNDSLGLGGFVGVSATAKAGHTVKEMEPLLQSVIDDVKKNGVTAAEVERARRNILAGKLRGVERIGGFGGKADLLNQYETFVGDPGYIAQDLQRYRDVTPESVQAFAQKYMPDDRRLILDTEPAQKSAALVR